MFGADMPSHFSQYVISETTNNASFHSLVHSYINSGAVSRTGPFNPEYQDQHDANLSTLEHRVIPDICEPIFLSKKVFSVSNIIYSSQLQILLVCVQV